MKLSKDEAYALTHEIPEIRWAEYGLTVVRDGYTVLEGTRIHFVKEPGYDGEIIANAFIFSDC